MNREEAINYIKAFCTCRSQDIPCSACPFFVPEGNCRDEDWKDEKIEEAFRIIEN
jgi:hypothetical protein